jgi:hypothetical protein
MWELALRDAHQARFANALLIACPSGSLHAAETDGDEYTVYAAVIADIDYVADPVIPMHGVDARSRSRTT